MYTLNYFAGLLIVVTVARVQGTSVTEFFTSDGGNTLRENDELETIDAKERPTPRPHTNTWAVRIRGGPASAESIARKYGFDNQGLVEGFTDVYNFQLSGGRQSARSDVLHTSKLASDKNVVFAEQQVRQDLVTKFYAAPQDLLFEAQWHLQNPYRGFEGRDLRVEQAWLQGLTGCNVTVSVVDDGIDYKHPDLWPNFAPLASYDFIGNDSDPSVYGTFTHGTRCSGVLAAAQDNLHCGVGVAHQSNLGSLKLLDREGNTDMEVASALSHARNLVDVYSNSWGPRDNGSYVAGPRNLTNLALKEGVTSGRGGRGSIFVFANGNGGEEGDDCAADGYSSSIYTISVGAIGVYGRPSGFDEQCAAKMVVAYVTFIRGNSAITTTDQGGGCIQTFGGTSAATPMVSGAIALALEANPHLTWRDVQYLIAYTANPHLTAGPLTRNGAGLAVSRQYGFGVLDTEAMVTRARHWINVPPQMNDSVTPTTSTLQIPGYRTVYGGSISYLEHVVVRISVNVPTNVFSLGRGDLYINVTSPFGTLSTILMPRAFDRQPGGYIDWPFMSVMFWGENPTGQWTVNIETRFATGVAEVTKVEIEFYGVSRVPEAVANIPDQCHSDCKRGCARQGSNYCDSCDNLRNAHTLECIDQCPSGYTEHNGYCYDATLPFKECNSPLKNKENTDFTQVYEPLTCSETGITECCPPNSFCGSALIHPHKCFCDTHCYKFDDCCEDSADIGCQEENATKTFPYVDMDVTPGVEQRFVNSSGISPEIKVAFPFIIYIETSLHITVNGFFRFGTRLEEQVRVVAPFIGANNASDGQVSYEIHNESTSSDILSFVSSIINEHQNISFRGTWLIVATWENVTENGGDPTKTNTFQGIIITDFITSYAVFTYNCGHMSFSHSRAAIGFAHNGLNLDITHGATHRNDTHKISCFNDPHSPWVNLVYQISFSDNECEGDNGDCEQVCIDTFLSYNCSCEDGFSLNADGYNCSDIDECLSSDHRCEQICENTVGSYSCNCTDGYRLDTDGLDCSDIDECLSDNDCEQECWNTVGSYYCECGTGFELDFGDGRSCLDMDECLGQDHGCEQICVNTVGSYACNCTDGYTFNAIGPTCDDIDECLLDHDCEQECENTVGSYVCKCSTGFEVDNDGLSCRDIDECLSPDNGCEQICNNTVGSYVCSCMNGFTLNADGRTCDDIDECLSGHGCVQECENTQGSYVCICIEGYELDVDNGRSCLDIDECLSPDNGCEQSCNNTVGSYDCSCTDGYRLDTDGRTCNDIDECLLDHDCEQECENIVGSYVCKCSTGFEVDNDGLSCIDVEECLGSSNDCEDVCINTVGSYYCNCSEGYELNDDKRTCKDVDECALSTDECDQNCFNTEGSYTCSCRDGYVLNGDGLTCSVSCSGTFTNLIGSFQTPDWPDSYPLVDFRCVWEIVIDNSEASILIQFQEPYGIFGSKPCETDYVEVLSNSTSVGKHCGTTVPDRIVVDSSSATVVFQGSAHSLMNRPGVSVFYRAIVEELSFLPLLNVDGAVTGDDGISEPIAIANRFPFGCSRKSTVYVGTNGYFTFSRFTGFTPFPFSSGNRISLVAPFFTDIDISNKVDREGSGRVIYQVYDDLGVTASSSMEIAQQVDLVINTNKLTNFSSEWLLVASWEEVSPYGNYNTRASFQGVLATDYKRSFAIFIYKCEDENASFSDRATIGFVARDGFYVNHEATFLDNPYSISCLDFPASQWTNVIYEISAGEDECK